MRIWAMVMTAFAAHRRGHRLRAQSSFGGAPYLAVVSGDDPRAGRGPYITQLLAGTAGGPGTAESDGWLSFLGFPAAGLLYRDSIEVLEQKYPMVVTRSEVRPDSEGAGWHRGAPGNLCEYGPIAGTMRVFWSLEGVQNLPEGVRGGESPLGPSAYIVGTTGTVAEHPEIIGAIELQPFERVGSRSRVEPGTGPATTVTPRSCWRTSVRDTSPSSAPPTRYGVVLTGDHERFETLRSRPHGDARSTPRQCCPRAGTDQGERNGHRRRCDGPGAARGGGISPPDDEVEAMIQMYPALRASADALYTPEASRFLPAYLPDRRESGGTVNGELPSTIADAAVGVARRHHHERRVDGGALRARRRS